MLSPFVFGNERKVYPCHSSRYVVICMKATIVYAEPFSKLAHTCIKASNSGFSLSINFAHKLSSLLCTGPRQGSHWGASKARRLRMPVILLPLVFGVNSPSQGVYIYGRTGFNSKPCREHQCPFHYK